MRKVLLGAALTLLKAVLMFFRMAGVCGLCYRHRSKEPTELLCDRTGDIAKDEVMIRSINFFMYRFHQAGENFIATPFMQ